VTVANRVRARSADPLLDEILRVVRTVRQTGGDLLGPSSASVVLERRDRRRAFLHFDEPHGTAPRQPR